MQLNYLTKSDFKVAQTCPTKLYYRKKSYPTRDDGDEYLALLANQGYLIEALARALYPDGQTVGYRQDVESAAWETMSALSDSCTLFEATFIGRGKMARVDILVRRGDVFELIEIKSRGFDREKNDELVRNGRPNLFRSARNPAEIHNDWRPYIEDAAFQVGILQDVFPNARIIPFLLMPDVSRPCPVDGLHHRFALRSLSDTSNGSQLPSAEYIDDPRDIRRNLFLTRVNVEEEVGLLLSDVRARADVYSESLLPVLRRIPTPISTNCAACEYRVTDGNLRGFHECWGELADVTPHILELYRVGDLGGRKEPLANKLLGEGKASLYDIPEKRVSRRDGSVGEQAIRQRLQIDYTRANRVWVSDELGAILESLVYPLYFVDFETCAPAIPRYKGMRPFETIAFQWCCQTLTAPDAEPQHSEWLQTADVFPNADFAGALRRRLGDRGSILVWGSHEATVLDAIRRQLAERDRKDSELSAWLGKARATGRMVDLNRLTLKHYFHPRMGGRTSLKVVADAVWQANSSIRARLPQYILSQDGQESGNGPAGPYKALPSLAIGDKEVSVSEGSGAVLAYYAMIERSAADATLEANRWRQLLRQYCTLDTLAMVMVWWHWRQLTGQAK
jgi:hypothetical protein